MNRRLFLWQAIGIASVLWCLVACAESKPPKLDPALEGYSKENLTLSLTDLEISVFEPGTPTRETEQVSWKDDTTVEIRTLLPGVNCAHWIDVGYQLVDHNLIVKTIVGPYVGKGGGEIIAVCKTIYEVNVVISDLPGKDYQVQLRRGEAVEPRIHPSW